LTMLAIVIPSKAMFFVPFSDSIKTV